jgi:hypothetical protein
MRSFLAHPSRTRFINRNSVTPMLAFAAALPFLWLLKRDFVEPLPACLLIATILVGLTPSVLFLFLSGRQQAPLPFVALTGLFYVIFFALPPFFIERGWWTVGYEPLESGLGFGVVFQTISARTSGIVLGGVVALLAGYYVLSVTLPRSVSLVRLPNACSRRRFELLLWLLLALHLAFLYVPALRAVPSLAQGMAPIGYFAAGMIFMSWMRGHLGRIATTAFWALVVPLEIAIHIYEGLITPAVLFVVFLLALYRFVERSNVRVLALAILFAVVVFPLLKVSGARLGDWMSSRAAPREVVRVTTAETPLADVLDDAETIRQKILRRISLIVLLEYCVQQTPEKIPYLAGATMQNLKTNVVPRFLWSDKPRETIGQWFGHKYRILNPDDQRTSINLPWLVEFYINFGVTGVLLGMLLVGAAMAILEWGLLRASMSDVELLTGWSLLFPLIYQESNISLMIGGLVQQAILLFTLVYLMLRLSQWGGRDSPGGAARTAAARFAMPSWPLDLVGMSGVAARRGQKSAGLQAEARLSAHAASMPFDERKMNPGSP